MNHSSSALATIVHEPANTVGAVGDADVTDYQLRLAEAMRHDGRDPDSPAALAVLASQLDVSVQAVRKVFSGTSKALSAANNARVAKLLGVSPDWLALGEKEGGPMLGALPFSLDLVAQARKASPDDLRKAENAARNVLELDPLPRAAAGPCTKRQQRAAA